MTDGKVSDMIDYVRLACDVDIHPKQLNPMKWYSAIVDNFEQTYVHDHRGVRVRYYPERGLVTIRGKILMLLHDTQVLNVDDVYGTDTERFVKEINAYLNRLFTTPLLDIRWFRVTRIDYCFNVQTDHVQGYIDFMSVAFQRCNGEKRINYTEEEKLNGSVYVKTRSDYERNERRNYVLNFYDKTDRLNKLQADGDRIRPEDFEYTSNVLRLEVQCGDQFVRQLCKRMNISRLFGDLFDYAVAVSAVEIVYSRVFRGDVEQDFYAYDAAKNIIPATSEAAKRALKSASTHHSIRGDKYAHGRKVIAKAGIYPFCFLPKDCGIDRLDNPLKLIRKKLEDIGIAA